MREIFERNSVKPGGFGLSQRTRQIHAEPMGRYTLPAGQSPHTGGICLWIVLSLVGVEDAIADGDAVDVG